MNFVCGLQSYQNLKELDSVWVQNYEREKAVQSPLDSRETLRVIGDCKLHAQAFARLLHPTKLSNRFNLIRFLPAKFR